ncbi:hypothetical protein F383_07780 [Gossypium arboreum]|uniref:Uncharacterized protein n=1 Tax=Gossypium arboreum TaxID=29729 RepID=A0A0B0PPH9_GOSAR|nr:hypothetical protein F383_07780 [Gossypium arboreum]
MQGSRLKIEDWKRQILSPCIGNGADFSH